FPTRRSSDLACNFFTTFEDQRVRERRCHQQGKHRDKRCDLCQFLHLKPSQKLNYTSLDTLAISVPIEWELLNTINNVVVGRSERAGFRIIKRCFDLAVRACRQHEARICAAGLAVD